MKRWLPGVISAAVFSSASAVWPQPQRPPRDLVATPPVTATAVVRGRITAAATGQPLHRVRVTLNGQTLNNPSSVTDIQGNFEITNVPAGSYSLTAARAGYLTIQYGQRRPREAGRSVEITDGQLVEHIDVALFRGAVLAGRVVDDLGDPAPGVRVEAMDVRYVRGQRLPVQAGVAITNDIGEFRVSGLEPGTYALRASTFETWESDDEKKEAFGYAQTYYPGVTEFERSQRIVLAVGQESANLDIPLTTVPAARIRGILVDANGQPVAGQRVNVDRIERTSGGALFSAQLGGSTTTGPDGSFDIRNLGLGEYHLYSGDQNIGANLSMVATGGDMDRMVLTPLQVGALSGSIVTDEGTPPAFPAGRLRVTAIPADSASVLPQWGAPGPQSVRSDWTFRFGNIDGRYLFRLAGLPDDWMLKTVQMGERDFTDMPLEIPKGSAEINNVRVVVTRQAANVSGTVVDQTGKPLADSTVIVFATDSGRWGTGTRFVKAARPRSDGHFSMGSLPPGAYQAIAREFVPEGEWEDPDFIRSLAPDSLQFDLAVNESKDLTLKVQP